MPRGPPDLTRTPAPPLSLSHTEQALRLSGGPGGRAEDTDWAPGTGPWVSPGSGGHGPGPWDRSLGVTWERRTRTGPLGRTLGRHLGVEDTDRAPGTGPWVSPGSGGHGPGPWDGSLGVTWERRTRTGPLGRVLGCHLGAPAGAGSAREGRGEGLRGAEHLSGHHAPIVFKCPQ